MKTYFFYALLLIGSTLCSQNLLDTSTWTVGSGSVTGFSQNGLTTENTRFIGTTPFGTQEVIWEAKPSGDSGGDGGWNTGFFPVDHTRTFRFTVWIKKTNSNDGYTYHGFYGHDGNGYVSLKLDGTSDPNPYFLKSDLPALDKWYLLVGFVHGSGYSGTTSIGGIYDPVTGTKVANLIDYKFDPTTTQIKQRSYLFYDTNTNDRQYFYDPRVEEVNGQEPSITALLAGPNSGSGGGGLWSASGSDIYYNGGKVGIGTNSPAGNLHISSGTSGDATLRLEADTDNDNEDDNPMILIRQDGDGVGVSMGFSQENFGGNIFGIGTRHLSVDNWDSFVINTQNGNVGIGTRIPDSKLTVKGKIHAEEVKVDLSVPGPDYVFKSDYYLRSLEEIRAYIKKYGHLPSIPSAKEMETNGIDLGVMNMKLLEKVEELTLYILQQDKELIKHKQKNQELEKRLEKLEAIIK